MAVGVGVVRQPTFMCFGGVAFFEEGLKGGGGTSFQLDTL